MIIVTEKMNSVVIHVQGNTDEIIIDFAMRSSASQVMLSGRPTSQIYFSDVTGTRHKSYILMNEIPLLYISRAVTSHNVSQVIHLL